MRYIPLILVIAIIISITISVAGVKKGNIQEDKVISKNINVDLGTKKFGPYYQLWASGGYKYNINAVKKDIYGNPVPVSEDEINDLVEEYISQNPDPGLYGFIQWLGGRGYEVKSGYCSTENVKELANQWINSGLQPYMEILGALGINPRNGETGIAVTNQWPGRATGIYDIYSQNLNINVDEDDYKFNVSVKYQVQAEVLKSPIVLDLDGNNKIDTFLKNHNPKNVDPRYYPRMKFIEFDINGNGLNSLVEWLGPKDGFLIAPSENTFKTGEVTGNELFGTAGGYLDGFHKLSLYDKNKDNKLTNDELSNLYVWQDLNSNGKAEKEEIKKLDELNITEISLTHKNYESYYVKDGKKYKLWDYWPITLDIMKTKQN